MLASWEVRRGDMRLIERQQQWIEAYRSIEDRQERLAVIIDEARREEPLEESLRTEDLQVEGCVSKVWLQGLLQEDGKCRFRVAADSVMVFGLVSLLCRLYSGYAPEEVAETEAEILEALDFPRQISPTRMNGLYHVRQSIVEFARNQLTTS